MWFRLVTTLAISVPIAWPARAQNRATMDIESLEVVPGVLVVVEGVTPEAARDGLSTELLYADAEAMLRDAAIVTLTEREWSDLIGNPALHLGLQLLKPSPHLYLYTATLELRQLTVLVRDSTKGAWTRTWSAGTILGTTPTANLPSLRNEIRPLFERFITAYVQALERRGAPAEAVDPIPVISVARVQPPPRAATAPTAAPTH